MPINLGLHWWILHQIFSWKKPLAKSSCLGIFTQTHIYCVLVHIFMIKVSLVIGFWFSWITYLNLLYFGGLIEYYFAIRKFITFRLLRSLARGFDSPLLVFCPLIGTLGWCIYKWALWKDSCVKSSGSILFPSSTLVYW